MINPINGNNINIISGNNNRKNPSFNSITKMRVVVDGKYCKDDGVIKSVLDIFRKIALNKKKNVPDELSTLYEGLRNKFSTIDPDIKHGLLRRTKISTGTTGSGYYFVSGNHYMDLVDSGTRIGTTKKILENSANSRNGAIAQSNNDAARSYYGALKSSFATNDSSMPTVTVYATSQKKGYIINDIEKNQNPIIEIPPKAPVSAQISAPTPAKTSAPAPVPKADTKEGTVDSEKLVQGNLFEYARNTKQNNSAETKIILPKEKSKTQIQLDFFNMLFDKNPGN